MVAISSMLCCAEKEKQEETLVFTSAIATAEVLPVGPFKTQEQEQQEDPLPSPFQEEEEQISILEEEEDGFAGHSISTRAGAETTVTSGPHIVGLTL